jgi:hypothetical protein
VASRGLSAQDACEICFVAGTVFACLPLLTVCLAGMEPRVEIVDVSEYNPQVEEHRTGRLVAHMFYYFCLGMALRLQRRAAAGANAVGIARISPRSQT